MRMIKARKKNVFICELSQRASLYIIDIKVVMGEKSFMTEAYIFQGLIDQL